MENNEYLLNDYHNQIDYITKQIKLIENQVRELVINKDISLDERWDLFCKFANECNRAKCYSVYSFKNRNFQTHLDSKEIERDMEVDIDWELDNYSELTDEDCSEEQIQRDIAEVKEECLENFIYSYYNCW